MFQLFGFLLSLFGSSKVSDKSDIDRIERQIEEWEARKAEEQTVTLLNLAAPNRTGTALCRNAGHVGGLVD